MELISFAIYIHTMIKIYHHSQCSKSRQALAYLQEHSAEIVIQEYMQEVPSRKELKHIVDLLGIKPLELIRQKESIFIEQFKGKSLTDEEWIDAMLAFPILIERPIIIQDGKAVIGRPIENLIQLIEG